LSCNSFGIYDFFVSVFLPFQL